MLSVTKERATVYLLQTYYDCLLVPITMLVQIVVSIRFPVSSDTNATDARLRENWNVLAHSRHTRSRSLKFKHVKLTASRRGMWPASRQFDMFGLHDGCL